jgi:hypothetical protein
LQTFNFGMELMDAALTLPLSGRKQRKIQYRDGLLWPCSAFGRYAVAASPPSASAVTLSSTMQA